MTAVALARVAVHLRPEDNVAVAARQGDLDEAIRQGEHALNGQRKSLPSLLMVSRDLTRVLNDLYPAEGSTQQYLKIINGGGYRRG